MQLAQALREGVSGWMRGTDYIPSAGSAEIALSSADPTYDASGVSEPSGNGYARQSFSLNNPTTFGNVRERSNDSPIIFTATGDWGSVTHGVLYRGTTAMWQGALNASRTVGVGNALSFAAGSVQITAGSHWSDYARDQILAVIEGGSLTAPSGLFLALSTSDPSSDGSTITEPSGNYARQSVTLAETANNSLGIIVSNTGATVFGPASTNWGNVSHMALYDAVTGGNMIAYGPVAVQQNIVSGDAYAVSINSLALTIR